MIDLEVIVIAVEMLNPLVLPKIPLKIQGKFFKGICETMVDRLKALFSFHRSVKICEWKVKKRWKIIGPGYF